MGWAQFEWKPTQRSWLDLSTADEEADPQSTATDDLFSCADDWRRRHAIKARNATQTSADDAAEPDQKTAVSNDLLRISAAE